MLCVHAWTVQQQRLKTSICEDTEVHQLRAFSLFLALQLLGEKYTWDEICSGLTHEQAEKHSKFSFSFVNSIRSFSGIEESQMTYKLSSDCWPSIQFLNMHIFIRPSFFVCESKNNVLPVSLQ